MEKHKKEWLPGEAKFKMMQNVKTDENEKPPLGVSAFQASVFIVQNHL